jgi:hypothetical protein
VASDQFISADTKMFLIQRFGCPNSWIRAIVIVMTAPSVKLVTSGTEVRIAGVPWPTYKLVALAVGLLVLLVVGIATMDPGPAVVAAAAAGTVVWLGLGVFQSSHD